MTKLVTSLLCTGPSATAAAIQRAFAAGTDAVEIRVDGWEGSGSSPDAPLELPGGGGCIVTCRPASEGGCFQGDLDQRVARLIRVAADNGRQIRHIEREVKREREVARQAARRQRTAAPAAPTAQHTDPTSDPYGDLLLARGRRTEQQKLDDLAAWALSDDDAGHMQGGENIDAAVFGR